MTPRLLLLAAALAACLCVATDARAAVPKVKASVKRGTLVVTGTRGADKLALRAASRGRLAVDLRDDGKPDFLFARKRFTRIVVDTGAGSDFVRIDESKGNFTLTEATSVDGKGGVDSVAVDGTAGADALGAGPAARAGHVRVGLVDLVAERLIIRGLAGNDTISATGLAAGFRLTLDGGDGNDTVRGGLGNDTTLLGAGDDAYVWGIGEGADQVQGDAGTDTVTIDGTGGGDTIAVGPGATAGQVAAGGVDLAGGERVVLSGLGGDDLLSATGSIAPVQLVLDGGDGNDSIVGAADAETLLGGAGNDALDGHGGADAVALGAGNDVFTWDAGDGADQVQGDDGSDTAAVNGTAAAETIDVTAPAPGHVTTTGGPDLAAFESLVVNAFGGDDTLTNSVSIAPTLLTLDGYDGNDTLNAGPGNDTLRGGNGNDTFVWDPGDGSDTIRGEGDQDTLRFNGSAAAEVIGASSNAGRLLVTRNIGSISLDADDVESLELVTLAGADVVTVGDLSPTDVRAVRVDLGVSGIGDLAADSVTVTGSEVADVVQAAAVSSEVQVTGLVAPVTIAHTEAAFDRLTVSGLGGNDTLSGGTLAALMQLTLDGGVGVDTLNGGNGADTLLGGTENDTVDGNGGNDVAFLGNDNDTFVWDPGDGSDIVEGQTGQDTIRFNGSAGAEIFAASANGGRLLFTRNVGNIIIDADDVETLNLNALGGADTVTINGLASTDLQTVNLDLGVVAAGDGALDVVAVNGTVGADVVGISGGGGSVTVSMPSLALAITHSEPANDRLTVNGAGGADSLNASALAATSIVLTLNGGTEGDGLVGSDGADTINGDANDDTLVGGPGNDTLDGGANTDFIDGGTGTDTAANGEFVVNVP